MKKRPAKKPNTTQKFTVYLEAFGYFNVRARDAETAEKRILNRYRRRDPKLEPLATSVWAAE